MDFEEESTSIASRVLPSPGDIVRVTPRTSSGCRLDTTASVSVSRVSGSKRKADKGKDPMEEPSKKSNVPEDRREFLRAQLSATIYSFPCPSFASSERPGILEEIAVAKGLPDGGFPSIPKGVLEVSPLTGLFDISDDSELEDATREIVVAQPLDIPVPEFFKPPREPELE